MAKKDKFKEMQQGGALGSFQDIVAQAATVAAIEKQEAGLQSEQGRAGEGIAPSVATATSVATAPSDPPSGGEPAVSTPPSRGSRRGVLPSDPGPSGASASGDAEIRYMRLPNPLIRIAEYNLVTRYCEQFFNMTRMDFVELAIIEKLHADGLLPDDDFTARRDEIRRRPPRGHRKGTKNTPK